MKTRFIFSLMAATLLLTSLITRAADDAKAPADQPKLSIVVVENVQRNPSANAISDFDRVDLAFQYVAKQRKWPVTIAAERLVANTPNHETELRVFLHPVREETPGDLTIRAWMALTIQGVKHDFGIITFRYYMRGGEQMDDVIEKVFRGAAETAATKIEPLLFPKPDAVKS